MSITLSQLFDAVDAPIKIDVHGLSDPIFVKPVSLAAFNAMVREHTGEPFALTTHVLAANVTDAAGNPIGDAARWASVSIAHRLVFQSIAEKVQELCGMTAPKAAEDLGNASSATPD